MFYIKETIGILLGREDMSHLRSLFVSLPLYLIRATSPHITHLLSISNKGTRAANLNWVEWFSLRHDPDFTFAINPEKLYNFWERIIELGKRVLEILGSLFYFTFVIHFMTYQFLLMSSCFWDFAKQIILEYIFHIPQQYRILCRMLSSL